VTDGETTCGGWILDVFPTLVVACNLEFCVFGEQPRLPCIKKILQRVDQAAVFVPLFSAGLPICYNPFGEDPPERWSKVWNSIC